MVLLAGLALASCALAVLSSGNAGLACGLGWDLTGPASGSAGTACITTCGLDTAGTAGRAVGVMIGVGAREATSIAGAWTACAMGAGTGDGCEASEFTRAILCAILGSEAPPALAALAINWRAIA